VIETEINCDGAVSKIKLQEPGKLYLFPPKVVNTDGDVGGARALAIVRPNFRGKYQCYYRYANDTVTKEQGGPLYSNLSPVNEVDAGDCAKKFTWTLPATAPDSATHIELWRSDANQATTLFRLVRLPVGTTTYEDTIHDKDVRDPKRADFDAKSILLSDGRLQLNAYGTPSSDFAVGTVFQDRAFLAVDTTGKRPNTLLFSEQDRPESMPEVNEIILQQNVRDSDYITALIPFAGALMVMQAKHCYRLNFVSRPEIDTTAALVAYRGCLNQRCWDIWMGTCYVLDDHGFYKMDQQGSVEDVSDAIATLFCTSEDPLDKTLDFAKRKFWFVRADKNLGVIRIHVSFVGDEGTFPTRQIVYDPDSKAFWVESYPYVFSAGSEIRTEDGFVQPVVASESGVHILANGLTDDGNPVPYAFRTGNMAYEDDQSSKTGAQQNSRGISVLYTPTAGDSLVRLELFYNASEVPRQNVARREVFGSAGFTADDADPSSFMNMKGQLFEGAPVNGIARALFAGKTITAFSGNDTHVSVRLKGEQSEAGPIILHEISVNGVQGAG
jgi:hypothetical protein